METTIDNNADLPHWDLSTLFPGIDSEEFARGFDKLVRDIHSLSALFDEQGIDALGGGSADGTLISRFERALTALNDVELRP